MSRRRILITGGSRGIGRAIVEMLAKNSENQIVFTYKQNESAAKEVITNLETVNNRISALQLDLVDSAQIQKVIQLEIEQNGNFDTLILNAGITEDTVLFFMEERQWKDVLAVSLNSFFYLTKLVLPHMIQQRWGRIVSIASISGEAGNRGQANYAAAKGALISATKSLAKEVSSRGVLANIVSPGLITTEMTESLPKDELKKIIPMGRFGNPDEVASAVNFLVSDEASYISGEVLRVNGGLYT